MTQYCNKSLQGVSLDVPSHTTTLLEGLSHLRSKDLLLDVTLSAQGQHFTVGHMLYLFSLSINIYCFNNISYNI